jgi:hypothetical protein
LVNTDEIDLAGVFTVMSDNPSGTTVTLVLTDQSGDAENGDVLTLTFDSPSGTLNVGSDGSGGTLITDPPATVPATAEGAIAFGGGSPTDTYSESVTAEGANYIGSLSVQPVSESNGSGSVGWTFDLGNDQINLAPGQTLTQSYDVAVTDAQNPAMSVNQTVSVSIGGPGNDNFVFAPGVGADTIVNFNPTADTIELDNFANVQNVQQLASLITTDAHGDAVIELGHNDSITIPGVTANYLQAHLANLVHLH